MLQLWENNFLYVSISNGYKRINLVYFSTNSSFYVFSFLIYYIWSSFWIEGDLGDTLISSASYHLCRVIFLQDFSRGSWIMFMQKIMHGTWPFIYSCCLTSYRRRQFARRLKMLGFKPHWLMMREMRGPLWYAEFG